MTEQTTEQLLAEELKGKGSDPEATSTEPDNQDPNKPGETPEEGKDKAGSEGDEPTNTPKKYKVLDQELDSDQLYDKYGESQAYIEKLQRENAELKKGKPADPNPETPESPKSETVTLDPKDELVIKELERLGFTRADAVNKIIDEKFTTKEKDIITKAVKTTAARTQVMEGLTELEQDFDGSNDESLNYPKPKVDRTKILDYIQKNPTTDMSLLDIAKIVHRDDFIKYEARKMSVQPTSLPKTEGEGLNNGGKPPPPKKYNFNDNSVEAGLSEMLGVKK